jgi:hypothetical protein
LVDYNYLNGGIGKKSPAKELILLSEPLEKYVKDPLCIGVSRVC